MLSQHQERLVEMLFDAITGFNCLTHADIAVNGGFTSVGDVDQALAWIRDPEVADEYGWTVPHVRRGRPREDQDYRYIVVGLSGEVLSPDDIRLVREGALSTVRLIAAETRNEAHALRLTGPMVVDAVYRKWAKQTATILDGISQQASLEADRLESLLAVP